MNTSKQAMQFVFDTNQVA